MAKRITDKELSEFSAVFGQNAVHPESWKTTLEPFFKPDFKKIDFSLDDPYVKVELQRRFSIFFDQVLINGDAVLAQKLMSQFVDLRKRIKEPEEWCFPINIDDFELKFYDLEENVSNPKAFENVVDQLKKVPTPPQGMQSNSSKDLRKRYEEALISKVFGMSAPEEYNLSFSSDGKGITLITRDEKTNTTKVLPGDSEKFAQFMEEDYKKFYN